MLADNVVIITRPKINISARCPHCQSTFEQSTAYINGYCTKCNRSFRQGLNMAVTSFFVGLIKRKIKKLQRKGKGPIEIILQANDNYKTFLIDIADHFDECDKIPEKGTERVKVEYPKVTCLDCGHCNNCLECECGAHFEGANRCPKCNSLRVKKTWFGEAKKKEEKKVCQYCGSEDISFHRFVQEGKEPCPKCGSNNITKKKKDIVNQIKLTLMRMFER